MDAESFTKYNFTHLFALTGKFRLTSKLVPKSNKRKIYRMLTSKRKDEGGGGGLEMLVYEQCSVRVSHVQLVLSNRLLWRTDLDRVNTERHIVFPFEVHLDIGRSIVPKEAARFAKVTISGKLFETIGKNCCKLHSFVN